MGKFDSSKTRVVPVFDRLHDLDPTGAAWLGTLMALGSRFGHSPTLLTIGPTIQPERRYWGAGERRLPPPLSLLEWLVANASPPSSDALWGSEKVRSQRERLVARDPQTIQAALTQLKGRRTRGAWYVLEGPSSPDVFIETEHVLLVVEGKRTERKLTTDTTWMPRRSQILRHMDAAWEIRAGRRVLGLVIVEGSGGADALAPSRYWIDQANDQVSDDLLENSLPHRDTATRKVLSDGFLGVTTWQRVCQEFGIAWPPYADVT